MKKPPMSGTLSLAPAELALSGEGPSVRPHRPVSGLLARAWSWMRTRQLAGGSDRRLRVAETVSLGEKRFVAVVQVDGRHFLVAGGPTNIALLAQLDEKEPFANVLEKTMTVAKERPAKRRTTQTVHKVAAKRAGPVPQKTTPPSAQLTRHDEKTAPTRKVMQSRAANSIHSAPQGETPFLDLLSKAMAEAAKHPAATPRTPIHAMQADSAVKSLDASLPPARRAKRQTAKHARKGANAPEVRPAPSQQAKSLDHSVERPVTFTERRNDPLNGHNSQYNFEEYV